jgi:hypothetical protein
MAVKSKTKFVQIAVAKTSDKEGGAPDLYALDEDGKVWAYYRGRDNRGMPDRYWFKLSEKRKET